MRRIDARTVEFTDEELAAKKAFDVLEENIGIERAIAIVAVAFPDTSNAFLWYLRGEEKSIARLMDGRGY